MPRVSDHKKKVLSEAEVISLREGLRRYPTAVRAIAEFRSTVVD